MANIGVRLEWIKGVVNTLEAEGIGVTVNQVVSQNLNLKM